jgi:DNA repair protein RadC
MKSIKEIRDTDRPREKIARLGVENLSNNELIAAIIGRGISGRDVNMISADIEKILEKKRGSPSYDEFIAINGIGSSKASQIIAAFELARRYSGRSSYRVEKPEDVLPLVDHLRSKKQEYFICMTLNGAGELIEQRIVTVGLLNHSPVHPREVFADAITDRAASVLFIHNHPSGSPEPSAQDIDITKRLCEAAEILGISVLDHIITAKRGYVSFKQRGLL